MMMTFTNKHANDNGDDVHEIYGHEDEDDDKDNDDKY